MMKWISCEYCKILFLRRVAEIKRAENRGWEHFCSKKCAGAYKKRLSLERFKKRISMTLNCIEWDGCLNKTGYGVVRIEGKPTLAHRAAWAIEYGDIPKGFHVLHKCDNPKCINPSHLFIGKHIDNMRDMYIKGRQNSTISYQESVEIKASTLPNNELAYKYGIKERQIRNIRSGKSWGLPIRVMKHMPLPEPPEVDNG